MSEKVSLLTSEQLKNREEELEHLRTVTRKEVTEKIKVALGFGDLSENSEYDEAKNEQAQVEARIMELEAMLKNVKIIDESEINTDVVGIGATVTVYDTEYDEELTYRIFGSSESNPALGSISDESPLGKALIGHGVGEIVDVEAPGGIIRYEIRSISR